MAAAGWHWAGWPTSPGVLRLPRPSYRGAQGRSRRGCSPTLALHAITDSRCRWWSAPSPRCSQQQRVEAMRFDTPATTNPIDQLKVIGKPTDRIDGRFKTTGTAPYAYEWHDNVPNYAYGYIVGAA